MASERDLAWWNALGQGGLFLDPERLDGDFGRPAERPLPAYAEALLRRELDRFGSGGELAPLLDVVLESVAGLGLPGISGAGRWLKAADVPAEFRRPTLTERSFRPRRVWQGLHGACLPVFTDGEPRLGIGRGKRAQARVLEWLRAADGFPLALLTNGRQWRLLYAGPAHEAYLEWDTELWFEEGRPGPQVDALRVLLHHRALTPPVPGAAPPLLHAIHETRKGQTRLSGELGERVRRAVEILVRETLKDRVVPDADRAAVYAAAVRAVMRLVVILFAESRDLLPRDNAIYHESYGLQSLRAALERQRGDAERLGRGRSAWPRLLGLYRLVHEGSRHERMLIHRYGGNLFAADLAHDDLFRDPAHGPDDAKVAEILRLLTRGAGERPVDFAGLSTEYIGILYEGLLDYELHQAPPAQPVVFLDLGDQPALPLGRLEALAEDEKALAALVEKAKRKKTVAVGDEEGDEEDEDEKEEAEEPVEEENEEAGEASSPAAAALGDDDDAHAAARRRAETWARRAVRAGKLVARPRSKKPEVLRRYEEEVAERARALLAQIRLPGEWYLVRFGGTRKGAGTFYTKPELARPTVERTLRPLAYDAAGDPRKPEEILALKVCDPACGSGSFLVASLRYLSEALLRSLHHHGRIEPRTGSALLKLAEGQPGGEALPSVAVKLPLDHPEFEDTVRAQLKRYVVERCLYGVDLDPIAVELCRVSLWVETMDRDLPFSFLDHKIKVGNSLVGCWFDRFRDYPVMAWEREGGDKNHGNGVHFRKEEWSKAIRAARNGWVKEALADWIRGQRPLLGFVAGETPEAVHDRGLARMAEMHHVDLHEPEKQADLYALWEADTARVRLKEAFDTWCALWFWPADLLGCAPRPADFENPTAETRAVVKELTARLRFFHWELEFPDVFHAGRRGFDAVVGNPPWETQKPISKEFFSNHDPLYRGYGKQDAVRKQTDYFAADRGLEREWLLYCGYYKALSVWCKHAAEPYGDPEAGGCQFSFSRSPTATADLHRIWRARRAAAAGYADPEHPYRHQGSADRNSYKLFLETGHALLRAGGRLGFLVPSGLYTDKGSLALRALFLDRCRWEWLFSFENRDGIFDIHRSFKFCPVILEKGGRTESVQAAFMHRDLADWAEAERHATPYDRARIERFSPKTRAFLEIRGQRDLAILEKVYANSVLLGDDSDDGWKIRYATEFHMTNDSELFPPRPQWEAKGYRPDEYSRWLLGPWRPRTAGSEAPPDAPRHALAPGVLLSRDGTQFLHESEIQRDPESGHPGVALPLYQGVMLWQYDFAYKLHIRGSGLRAKWEECPWTEKHLQPQFLMARREVEDNAPAALQFKISHRRVQNVTNERTMIGTVLPGYPGGDTVAALAPLGQASAITFLTSINAFPSDWVIRKKVSQNHVDFHYISDAPVLPSSVWPEVAIRLAMRLSIPNPVFSPLWHQAPWARKNGFRALWALTEHERLRIRAILDAVAAERYGLDFDDLKLLLQDCDRPAGAVGQKSIRRTLDPKGFWRVDKDRDPELRHTVLSLAAFADLQSHIAAAGGNREQGIQAFLTQNDGEGWMLPETLRLADLDLGHDDRARHAQPVAERLGPRFLPFQLEEDREASWQECALHARNLLGDAGYQQLVEGPRPSATASEHTLPGHSLAAESMSGPGTRSGRRPYQEHLFPGEPTLFDPPPAPRHPGND